MFICNTNAKTLLDETVEELKLYGNIPRATFRRVLNETLGRLYNEVVYEVREAAGKSVSGEIALSSLPVSADSSNVREEDVLRVFHAGSELQYLPPRRFALVSNNDGNFYTVQDGKILLSPSFSGYTLQVSYLRRPRPYSEGDEGRMLPMPEEYVSLVRAKLRGEIYKLANEDALSAKWLGEYNATLPAFAAYCRRVKGG